MQFICQWARNSNHATQRLIDYLFLLSFRTVSMAKNKKNVFFPKSSVFLWFYLSLLALGIID